MLSRPPASVIAASAPSAVLDCIRVDLSISKRFTTFENQNLEIRGEFLNVSNTPILNAPNHSIGSTLGVINGSQGARNIQLGVEV